MCQGYIMPDQFFQDKKDLGQLQQFFKNAPKAFQRVSAGFHNRLAFDGRKNFQKEIRSSMTIRSPGLLNKLTRFKTTKKNVPINKQESSTFTLTMDRHEGWVAVNTGKTVQATKFTTAGRGGSETKKSLTGARLGRAHTGPQDFGLPDNMSYDDVVNYLQRISATPSRRRKSWFLPVQFRGMPPGIYKFIGGKVRSPRASSRKTRRKLKATLIGARIVRLSDTEGRMKPEKDNWHDRANKRTLRRSNLIDAWEDNYLHEINKIKVK